MLALPGGVEKIDGKEIEILTESSGANGTVDYMRTIIKHYWDEWGCVCYHILGYF